MSEMTITFNLFNDDNGYVLSMNMDAKSFITAMRNRDEAPEFFVGIYDTQRPHIEDMEDWERELLDSSLPPVKIAEKFIVTEKFPGNSQYEAVAVNFLFSTRDVERFIVEIDPN